MNATAVGRFERSSTHFVPRVAATLALAMTFAVAIVPTPAVQAQTFQVVYTFTGGVDRGYPQPGLTTDGAGNFYGATSLDCGSVFHFWKTYSGWILSPLYDFQGLPDGYNPSGRVTVAQDGTLYGVTYGGGQGDGNCQDGCGTVYHLRPAAAALAQGNETVIHSFTIANGWYPQGVLTFDHAGNFYVTVELGGASNGGSVYKFTLSGSGWIGAVIHSFGGLGDGLDPAGGVIIDKSGNLYGVTVAGGRGGGIGGMVYELSPSKSGWTEHILYSFSGLADGGAPVGGLMMDSSGNLYGTTTWGGNMECDPNPPYGCGTVFKLVAGNSGWALNTLYSFSSGCGGWCAPQGKLVMDAAGNLYGTTAGDGVFGAGNVFKLSPGSDGWVYTSLHDFTGQSGSDGAFPEDGLVLDANGNLYGTASEGGTYNQGTVYEIMP